MEIKTLIVRYILTLAIFLGVDAVWLGVVAKNMYSKYLGPLMKESPNLSAALIFYLMYPLGILILSINPALKEKSLILAAFYGALLGLMAYSAYDLTNLATLKDWPVFVTVVDIIWGTLLTGFVSAIVFLILK